jgi:hypothetical protein
MQPVQPDAIIDECLTSNRYHVTKAMEKLHKLSATDRYTALFTKLDTQLQAFRAGAKSACNNPTKEGS